MAKTNALPHGLGWRPELRDPRDRIYKAPRVSLADIKPPLGHNNVRIHDQGQQGSCTGHGSTTMLEIFARVQAIGIASDAPPPPPNNRAGASDAEQLSRRMAYWTAREYINETKDDNGAYIRDVIRGFMKVGVSQESSCKYSGSYSEQPTKAAYANAKKVADRLSAHGIVYERCPDLGSVLSAINANQPVVFGFTCFNAIFDLSGSTPTSDILPVPTATEPPLGGHCVCADGFSLRDNLIDCINSWGTGWGRHGRFRMPFAWFTDARELTDDAWTLRKP
jgi:hypothetical protein